MPSPRFSPLTSLLALRLCACALALSLAYPASAADDYHQLLEDKKFSEVDKLASARLVKDPADAAAMIARVEAILNLDESRIDEAVAQAEKCVAAQPANGRCHLMLGQSMGKRAIMAGIMKSLGSAPTIRESLKKAVELAPVDVEARFSLLDYYVMAPRIVGGGQGKAETLVKETVAINPELARLMQAKMQLGEDMPKAEALAWAVKPGANQDLQDQHEAVIVAICGTYMGEKKFSDAERVQAEGQKRYPESESLAYMNARLQQEQGRHREAVGLYEKLAARHARPFIQYRLGKSLQALGDKKAAAAAFEKALAFKAGLSKNAREDATEQIKLLKA